MNNRLTADTIVNVHKYILADRTYEEVLSKFFSKKKEKDEFRQFLWLTICEQPQEKIINMWNEGYFLYWYISVVKNNVASSTSEWHRKTRKTKTEEIQDYNIPDDFVSLIEEQEEMKIKQFKLDIIEQAIQYYIIIDPLFKLEAELFKMYYYQNLSYREISKKTNISHQAVFLYVRSATEKIKKFIYKKRYIK